MWNTFGPVHILIFTIIVIFSVWIADLPYNPWRNDQPNEEKRWLVVGILSARGNFHLRDVIRKTWLQTITLNNEVAYKFILGDKDCDIHSDNRISPYSCERNRLVMLPDNYKLPIISFEGPDKEALQPSYHLQWNISLTVQHAIVVKQLGLHTSVILNKEPIRVSLFDERREEEIVFAKFSLYDPGTTIHSYRYQPVESFILPRDFIGSLRIWVDIHEDRINTSELKHFKVDFCGLVNVDYINELEMRVNPPKGNSIQMLMLNATVFDKDSYRTSVNQQDRLDTDHQAENRNTELKLQEEDMQFNDLLFVHVTDIYRNLPQKLLKFHQWVSRSMPADFVLKTDDDCYMDIEQILAKLTDIKIRDKIWWSNFRDNWLVERYGKWEERSYRSEVYPSFACGAGNIVSGDISDWIARNAEDLAPYQGEDVSMGIWLSAISVNYIVDDRWKCEKTCDKTALVIPELNVEEMNLFWKNKETCGNPCGCD